MQTFLEDASFNQSPPFADVDLFRADRPLVDAAKRYGLDEESLSLCGRDFGSAETLELGRIANENPPRLRALDGRGNRIDRVEFHPAYHALMAKSIAYGIHSSAHDGSEPHAPMTQRAMRLYMATQAESGHLCPITMTHACFGALAAEPSLLAAWKAKILSRDYDPSLKPWTQKAGVTIGMGMTERQGGTDVRANITTAVNHGDHVEISGHKWFMSAPMCDAFLVLAQGEGGLTCYLMPRFKPDGSLNALRFQRLKDKLGNKSNASSEVEFHAAYAQRIGPESQGVRTIIEMVQLTRIDCAVASAGLMRIALSQAISHIRNRSVFQRRLVDQPAMRAVAADLALELEAQAALAFRLARASDLRENGAEAAWLRLMTPAIKYLVCKSAPQFVYEALECLGGNGYSEELPLARYYREAPLNAIWEGSGNVMALDVLRAASRQPDAASDTIDRLAKTAGEVLDLPPFVSELKARLRAGDAERHARYICEGLARLAAVAALVEAGSPFASLYARTRFAAAPFAQYGASDLGLRAETELLERALAV
ncbi:MAG: acyl-CoA dehydrogenase family protein [Proteobacteria bacterium]|nr:acyl-CoA dehydrogenase family protein [Pseudomonadota bacterium]